MNKNIIAALYYLLLITFFSSLPVHSQISPSKYFIRFADRNNSPYTLSNPSAFLSTKAMARRTRQSISYVENDLPVNPDYVDSVASKGATVLTRSKWFNGVSIYITDSAELNAVIALPFVLSAKPVQLRKANKGSVNLFKNDVITAEHHQSMRTTQSYDYGAAYNQVGMIHLDSLHSQGYHGEGMTIAILDDGFYNADSIAAFDSVRVNHQILGTKDFVGGDADVFQDTVYGEGNILHGMWTFSLIGANLPGQLVGTAPKANFYLLRTEQNASENIIEEYNWDAGAEYADSAGADVFSTSLGYTTFDDTTQNHTYASMDGKTCPITIAAEIAASKGILVVNSAGNEGNSSWQYISAPADGDSVLTIGAVDSSGNYVSFSGKGPTYDGRLKPNVVAQGAQTVIADTGGGTTTGGGTSFSCPIIAGAAACLWQKYPNASNMQIFNAIEESASQYTHPDTLLGYGIPNFYLANILLSGIAKEDEHHSFTVYPNPALSYVTIASNHNTVKAELLLIDVVGRIVMKRAIGLNETIFQIDVNMLSKGVYFLQLISEEGTLETKMVKQ